MNKVHRGTLRLFALAIAVAPVIYLIFRFDFSSVTWTNDTASYVELDPTRQPLYGYFYGALTILGLQPPAVSLVQALGLFLSVTFLFGEVLMSRINSWILCLLIPVFWFVLVTHIFWMTTAFISEALFFPFLIVSCALVLRFLRTERVIWLYAVSVCVLLMVFTRGAAIGMLPATILALAVTAIIGKSDARNISIKAIAILLLLIAALPAFFGRGFFGINTPVDSSGFVFVPRVVMIPAPLPIEGLDSATWNQLNRSFISVGESMTCAERSMYESQLQEAVRYYIAPKLFFRNEAAWTSGNHDLRQQQKNYEAAFAIFKSAVLQRPDAYLTSTACHFWGMVTAGTHIGTSSRQKVFHALKSVDPETWELAPFRTDYPLMRFDISLKPHTELIYLGFRGFTLLATILGLVVTSILLAGTLLNRWRLDSTLLGCLLLSGWLLSHSLLVSLSVFPDARYVMANFVIQWALLALVSPYLFPAKGKLRIGLNGSGLDLEAHERGTITGSKDVPG